MAGYPQNQIFFQGNAAYSNTDTRMNSPEFFPRNVPFKPAPAFVAWFIIGFLLLVGLFIACLFVPLLVTGAIDQFVAILIAIAIVIVTAFFIVWTKLYYDSMFYELHMDELRWRRGVWFRTTGIVPYSRVTNIDIQQGPVMRWLGISSISLQTAGYSGQAVPEIRIEAIEHAEELRELLRQSVRACSGIAGDGTGSGPVPKGASADPVATTGTSLLLLDELKKIRGLLEQILKEQQKQ
jgi:membrane protein YdbS with pleckstrin-like domain